MSIEKPSKKDRILSFMLRHHTTGIALIEAMDPEIGINCSSYNQRVNINIKAEDGWPVYPKEENNAGNGTHYRHFIDVSTLSRMSGVSEPEVLRLAWTLPAGHPSLKNCAAFVEFVRSNARTEAEGAPDQCSLFNDPFGRLELRRNHGRT